jgi:hypothetical protein
MLTWTGPPQCTGASASACAEPVKCIDYQCQGPDPSSLLHECNPQPCALLSWHVTDWGKCSKACSSGTQTRNVTCFLGDGITPSVQRPSAECVSNQQSNPATSQTCNPESCTEAELLISNDALPGAILVAGGGSKITIRWQGGMPYGSVNIAVMRIRNGSQWAQDVVGPIWEAGKYSLPKLVYNSGAVIWTPPASMPAGHYLLSVTSYTNPNASSTLKAPFIVNAPLPYTILLLERTPGAGMGTAPSVQLQLYGTYPATPPITVLLGSTSSLVSTSANLLDAGVITKIGIVVPDATTFTAAAVVVIPAAGPAFAAGFATGLVGAVAVNQTVCGGFSRSCYECTANPGCGYCGDTGECMATVGGASQPAFGDCPSASWAPAADK